MTRYILNMDLQGTKDMGLGEHIQAIKKYGLCPIHRRSFTKKFV